MFFFVNLLNHEKYRDNSVIVYIYVFLELNKDEKVIIKKIIIKKRNTFL